MEMNANLSSLNKGLQVGLEDLTRFDCAPHQEVNMLCKASQEHRLLQARVAATDHHQSLAFIKRTVAGGTVVYAATIQCIFARDTKLVICTTSGNQHRMGTHILPINCHNRIIAIFAEARHLTQLNLRPKALCLALELLGEVEACYAVSKTWVVIDFIGNRCEATNHCFFIQYRLQVLTRRIYRGSQSAWPRANHDNVVDWCLGWFIVIGSVVHSCPLLGLLGMPSIVLKYRS